MRNVTVASSHPLALKCWLRAKALFVGAAIILTLLTAMRWAIFPTPYSSNVARLVVEHVTAMVVLVPVLAFCWISTLVGYFVIGKKIQVIDK